MEPSSQAPGERPRHEGQEVGGLVDHLFRREAGRIVASLTRSLGPTHLDLAEEVVQEAMLEALKRWPYNGVPERPAAWLFRVARNRALDRLRRDTSFRGKEGDIRHELLTRPERESEVRLEGEIDDDQLRLVLLCCHPEISLDSRVALTLKVVAGFSVPEIARAFFAKETTIAQRIVRAKERIRDCRLPFDVPTGQELESRLDSVLEVLYLMFNEGYASHQGDELVRSDLCRETLRLASELARLPASNRPTVHALAALLYFQASRLPARLDDGGNLVLLADQDRAQWDRGAIRQAFWHFERSAAGPNLTTYHVQAAIAAQHAMATSEADTDWPAILALYDQLLSLNPSPVVALNRAVALARVAGPAAGLAALAEIAEHPALHTYYLLPATRARLLAESGDATGAATAYRAALACPCSEPERRFLETRLAELEDTARD